MAREVYQLTTTNGRVDALTATEAITARIMAKGEEGLRAVRAKVREAVQKAVAEGLRAVAVDFDVKLKAVPHGEAE